MMREREFKIIPSRDMERGLLLDFFCGVSRLFEQACPEGMIDSDVVADHVVRGRYAMPETSSARWNVLLEQAGFSCNCRVFSPEQKSKNYRGDLYEVAPGVELP